MRFLILFTLINTFSYADSKKTFLNCDRDKYLLENTINNLDEDYHRLDKDNKFLFRHYSKIYDIDTDTVIKNRELEEIKNGLQTLKEEYNHLSLIANKYHERFLIIQKMIMFWEQKCHKEFNSFYTQRQQWVNTSNGEEPFTLYFETMKNSINKLIFIYERN